MDPDERSSRRRERLHDMNGHAVLSPVERLLTVNEVADVLRVSRAQLYVLVNRGDLRPTRVGMRMRFPPEEVRRYLSAGPRGSRRAETESNPTTASEWRADLYDIARGAAREEIASLAGLVLRRLQNVGLEGLPGDLREIFGEALADFSGHTGSGEEPGE